MASTILRLARLFTGWEKQPALFMRYWDETMTKIESNVNDLNQLPVIQAAVEAANTAAAAANAAAGAAQDVADTAQASTDASTREQALINSYIEPATVLSATSTTITISAHTRLYGDGTSVSVSGGSASATGVGDTDYVSYSDPARTGGSVTYIVSTTPPSQLSDIHVVGAVLIPTSGTTPGGAGPRRPGYVDPDPA